ncbi:MAG: Na+/H+ antiporter subunit G [Bacteroidales bacterium]|jgi:multicomponent Na+:H+ antiporter subunit G|nr:Na+/H+ antiporter subunit G [Bacteroidales bacterium]
MSDIVFYLLIGTGILFDLFGCIGLLRLPDVYNRLQSATKCVTLGTCCIAASLLARYGLTDYGLKALLIIPILFFTSTVAAHALARGSYKAGFPLWKNSVKDDYRDAHSTEEGKE